MMFLSLRTQFENLGDLLINRAVLELAAPRGVVAGVNGVPAWYRALILDGLGARVRVTRNPIAGFGAKVVLLKPGGYAGTRSLRMSIRRLLHAAYLASLRALGRRVLRMPSSQGSTPERFSWVESLRLSQMDDVLCRDAVSKVELDRLGANVITCPDLALHYFDRESLFGSKWSDLVGIARNRIVLSFRGDRGGAALQHLPVLVQQATDAGLEVVVVSQVTLDHTFNGEIARRFGAEIIRFDGHRASVRAIKDAYTTSRWVASDRLHSLLLGAINGATPIASLNPSRDGKVSSCLAQIGIGCIVDYADAGAMSSALRASQSSDWLGMRLSVQRDVLEQQMRRLFGREGAVC